MKKIFGFFFSLLFKNLGQKILAMALAFLIYAAMSEGRLGKKILDTIRSEPAVTQEEKIEEDRSVITNAIRQAVAEYTPALTVTNIVPGQVVVTNTVVVTNAVKHGHSKSLQIRRKGRR